VLGIWGNLRRLEEGLEQLDERRAQQRVRVVRLA